MKYDFYKGFYSFYKEATPKYKKLGIACIVYDEFMDDPKTAAVNFLDPIHDEHFSDDCAWILMRDYSNAKYNIFDMKELSSKKLEFSVFDRNNFLDYYGDIVDSLIKDYDVNVTLSKTLYKDVNFFTLT
jgi:hypothetical protein